MQNIITAPSASVAPTSSARPSTQPSPEPTGIPTKSNQPKSMSPTETPTESPITGSITVGISEIMDALTNTTDTSDDIDETNAISKEETDVSNCQVQIHLATVTVLVMLSMHALV